MVPRFYRLAHPSFFLSPPKLLYGVVAKLGTNANDGGKLGSVQDGNFVFHDPKGLVVGTIWCPTGSKYSHVRVGDVDIDNDVDTTSNNM